MMGRHIASTVGLVSAFVIIAAWAIAGRYTDLIAKNRVLQSRPISCQADGACQRYRDLFIADAHADTLLHRDPNEASMHGHVDLPRLLRGGVDLQIFAMAPVAPSMRTQGEDVCGSQTAANRVAVSFVVKEPLRPATWFSSHARVRRMIDRYDAAVEPRSDEPSRFIPLREAEDLEHLIVAREHGEPVVGALLAVEGFYWASADPKALRQQVHELRKRGVRMIGLTQRMSSLLAGSSEDCDDRGGLTDLGRVAVREIWRHGMILDLAHASPAVIADVAAMADDDVAGPVVVSHVGVQRTCDRDRNLSDIDARNVVRAGGVIGLGYWSYVACWSFEDTPLEVRRKLVASFVALHDILSDPNFRQEMGPGFSPTNHIALGSDFDGATTMPFDTSGIPWLLEGLAFAKRDGRPVFDDDAIAQIAGGNVARILSSALN